MSLEDANEEGTNDAEECSRRLSSGPSAVGVYLKKNPQTHLSKM